MNKHIIFISLVLFLFSCSNEDGSKATSNSTNDGNPTAIDTTQHATGITNSNVISTDTAAMKVDSKPQ